MQHHHVVPVSLENIKILLRRLRAKTVQPERPLLLLQERLLVLHALLGNTKTIQNRLAAKAVLLDMERKILAARPRVTVARAQNTTQGLPPAPRQQAQALLHVRVVEQGRGLPTNCQKLERTTTETIAEPRATGQPTRVLVPVQLIIACMIARMNLAIVVKIMIGQEAIVGREVGYKPNGTVDTGVVGKVVVAPVVGLLGVLAL